MGSEEEGKEGEKGEEEKNEAHYEGEKGGMEGEGNGAEDAAARSGLCACFTAHCVEGAVARSLLTCCVIP